MNQEQYEIPDIAVFGDSSKHILLRWLSGTVRSALPSTGSLWVTFGPHCAINRSNGQWFMTSAFSLPETVVYISGFEQDLDPTCFSNRTKFFVLEEFPFRRADTEHCVASLREKHPTASIIVVLMDLPRHHGSTDDVSSKDALLQAQESYENAHIPVCIAQNVKDFLSIFHAAECPDAIWRHTLLSDLQELQYRIDDVLLDYEFLLQDFHTGDKALLSQQSQSRVCSYTTVCRHKKPNVWNAFKDAFKRACFPASKKNGLFPVVALYHDILESSPLTAATASVNTDKFLFSLKNAFEQDLSCPETYPDVLLKSEDDFLSSLQPDGILSGIDIKFWAGAVSFIDEEIPALLQDSLKKVFEPIERILLCEE